MYGSKIIVSLGFILLFYSMSANATLDFTFDISDTSWATDKSDPTFSSGDTLSVSFLDTADLGNLINSDLVSWTWNISSVDFFQDNLTFHDVAQLSTYFKQVNSELVMVVGGVSESTTSKDWIIGNGNGFLSQLGHGITESIAFVAGDVASSVELWA